MPDPGSPRRHALPKARLFIAALSLTAAVSPAHAMDLCPDIAPLLTQARANFMEDVGRKSAVVPPAALTGAKDCTMSRSVSGANAVYCVWDFPYGDPAARALPETFVVQMPGFLGDAQELPPDLPINHPDHYDQRQYQTGEVIVTISIKDKGALQQTYVFIGVSGAQTQ